MKISFKYLSFCSPLLLLCSCVTTEPMEKVEDSSFYLREVGEYRVYDIEETVYSISQKPRNVVYTLKETVTASEKNLQQTIYKVERKKKLQKESNWTAIAPLQIHVFPNRILYVEDGYNYVKMTFPIQTESGWNQNEYMKAENVILEYTDLYKPYTYSNKNYPITVKVSQNNDSTLLTRNRNYSVYASKVGLVYEEKTNLFYCQSTPSCIGKGIIESGSIYLKKLVEFGKE